LLNIGVLALSTKNININIIDLSQPLLVEALVVLCVLEGFEVLAQRASNFTSISL
jgi:hypothetical protein